MFEKKIDVVLDPCSTFINRNMSNLMNCSSSAEANFSIYPPPHQQQQYLSSSSSSQSHQPAKKKRNLPGNPDPEAQVIALSPNTLLATNRFICEICNKGFQRDQNLQLHRRGHNLPWKLKQRTSKEIIRKKVYVCPEPTCVHHDPLRALGDLTGIKKHFRRKHGEKKWKCDKCSKRYAVQSDWKAHSKTCGTREYKCDCGVLFSRRDSFITHRAFCDALAEESARSSSSGNHQVLVPSSQPPLNNSYTNNNLQTRFLKNEVTLTSSSSSSSSLIRQGIQIPSWLGGPPTNSQLHHLLSHESPNTNPSSLGPTTTTTTTSFLPGPAPYSSHMSATALLQKAAQIGSTLSKTGSPILRTHTNPTHHVSAALNPQGHVSITTTHGFLSPSSSSTSDFDEALIINGGILNNPFKKDADNLHRGHSDLFRATDSGSGSRRTGSGGVGNVEGLTRDFLGLKPLSHNEILTMAGFGNCMSSSTSSSHHDQPIRQFQWQA
ncbi:hypothetical protein QN277_022409 [Acacia crassicarpa]|uniref:C2H2-type domain-containing protein n=2 Tax=Acacia crassicarpa TaxID=499986 RepID=A0AAE1JII6_9FABA|nr:hypothetical protein QN277_022409 [Acacia crassicarpa]